MAKKKRRHIQCLVCHRIAINDGLCRQHQGAKVQKARVIKSVWRGKSAQTDEGDNEEITNAK